MLLAAPLEQPSLPLGDRTWHTAQEIADRTSTRARLKAGLPLNVPITGCIRTLALG